MGKSFDVEEPPERIRSQRMPLKAWKSQLGEAIAAKRLSRPGSV